MNIFEVTNKIENDPSDSYQTRLDKMGYNNNKSNDKGSISEVDEDGSSTKNIKLNTPAVASIIIYSLGIGISIWIYYRILGLQHIKNYSRNYGSILVVIIVIMALNMIFSICNPPADDDTPPDTYSSLLLRTSNVVSFIFIGNIVINHNNHPINSKVTKNLMVIVIVSLMLNNMIVWIPLKDRNNNRILRDIMSVNLMIGLGYMIIFIVHVIQRSYDSPEIKTEI